MPKGIYKRIRPDNWIEDSKNRKQEYDRKRRSKPELKILQNKRHVEWVKRNKEIINRKRREWRSKPENKLKYKIFLLKNKYGLSYEEYQRKIYIQKGNCPICNLPLINGVVDHNHITNKVRDILCTNCNLQLGLIEKKPYLVNSMIEYLKKWEIIN